MLPRPIRSLPFLSVLLPLLFTAARAHPPTSVPIADLTRRIADHPDDTQAFLDRGELRRITGDMLGALADFEQVARLDPTHPRLAACRAALALDTGDPDQARRLLDQALAIRPGDVAALELRARALERLGEPRAAIADLDAAIARIAKPSPDLYLERARLQVAEGDRAAARAGLDEARARLGDAASLDLYAIELELESGSPAHARARFEALAASYGDRTALAGLDARIAAAERAAPVVTDSTPSTEAVAATASVAGPMPVGRAGSDGTDGVAAAPVVTRGPYLQMTTESAITVRWRTDQAVNSRVLYGSSPTSLTSSASDATSTTEHELRLTGLAAGTRYYYAIGTSTTVLAGDATYTFSTAPPGANAVPVRVWLLGDSGTGNSTADAVRNAYYTWNGTHKTDVWLMLGDNAYSTGTDSDYQNGVFDEYPTTLRQVALWPTRGNHDQLYSGANNDYYDIFSMPSAAQAGGIQSGTEAYYSFNWSNVHFVCLDSEGSDRSPGGAMLTWLANDLNANTRPWVIAYWHHPPYSKGSHDSDTESQLIQMRQNANPVLEAGGVDLVYCGHSHSYERSFLLNGHYGLSTTLSSSMIVDGGDGRPGSGGAYQKPSAPRTPHAGAVYTVAGSSGSTGGGSLDHPVMVTSLNVAGSVVVDVVGSQLTARFLNSTGAIQDSFVMLKGSTTGIERPAAAGFYLGPAYPNPFVGDLRMSYVLARAGAVRLSLFDAAGRRVAIVEDGWREAGAHEARWNGRDQRERALPTGLYLAVLEAGGTRLTRKVAMVR